MGGYRIQTKRRMEVTMEVVMQWLGDINGRQHSPGQGQPMKEGAIGGQEDVDQVLGEIYSMVWDGGV
jgi:hypothetical protein